MRGFEWITTGMQGPRCRQKNRAGLLSKSPNASQKFPKPLTSIVCLNLGYCICGSTMRSMAVRALCAAPPQTPATEIVRSKQRDDRGIMVPGCAGRGELMFPSFPAQPKPALASARRTHFAKSMLLTADVSCGKVAVKSRR